MDESPQENNLISEAILLDEIERIVRMTKKAYGYQHLSTIGTKLRDIYPDFNPILYGHKKLLNLIEDHPERFKIKWSAPAHKGRSHVWVRLSTEPKRKEGYADSHSKNTSTPKAKPRLMTAQEYDKLCNWLMSPKGCNFRPDPKSPDELKWDCDGTLRKTRQWLRRRDFLSLEGNSKLLRKLGGRCDCEVVFNVRGNWTED